MLKRFLLTAGVVLVAQGTLQAAPLFPDVPDRHWAKDAVAALAAKGLVEGYPDGTFKGDRSASRWEVAMIVARLLAREEAEHATFATKGELELVHKLAAALAEELSALGVRVQNLEGNTSTLDKRVTELERITFYGSLEARVGNQWFASTGSPGITRPGSFINYQDAVGSVLGVGGGIGGVIGTQRDLNQFNYGILPVADYALGRPLTNGHIMTALARLGIKANLSEDFEAHLELAAYSSQGDAFNDAYWGVSAPYLLNAFTGTSGVAGGGDPQGQNRVPFTRMVLDNFWVLHKPSGTSLTVGTFPKTRYDDLVYIAPENPNAFGTSPYFFSNEGGRFPNFGIQAIGETTFGGEDEYTLRWEAMGTRLISGFGSPPPSAYLSHAEGVNAALLFDDKRGTFRVNFLHAGDDNRGNTLVVGGTGGVLPVYNWTNPNGFYANQLGGRGPNVAGPGSTSDIRPIPVVPNAMGVGQDRGLNGFGAQSQISLGASLDYVFDNPYRPRVFAEYAHTDYTPQRNSGYRVGGTAFRVGASASFEEMVDVEVAYLSVDPTYDPYILGYPLLQSSPLVLLRLPSRHLATQVYALHNTEKYPQNREGFRGKVEYHFLDTGEVRFEYGRVQQRKPSLYDVAYAPSQLGMNIPNGPVLGFSPGFADFGFGPLAQQTYSLRGPYDPRATTLAGITEAPLGIVRDFSLGASYKWYFDEEQTRGLKVSGIYVDYNFYRPSNIAALTNYSPAGIRSQNINYTDYTLGGFFLAANYDINDWVRVNVSYSQLVQRGHYDRVGIYGDFALRARSTNFTNLDTVQKIPSLGFDLQLAEDVQFGIEGRYFDTVDLVDPRMFTVPATNIGEGPAFGTHPFSWKGWQLMSDLTVNF